MAAFLYRLMGSPPTSDTPSGFSDVPQTHLFAREIGWMTGAQVAEGFPDGTFRPTIPVDRPAMAAFLYRLDGSPVGPFPDPGFTDVDPTHPFFREISWMAQQGITTGHADGRFGVGETVTRESMAAFLQRYASR
jgi:hypothetical protein